MLSDVERKAAIERVRRAIQDPGKNPTFHREVQRKHRREWPTLWAALDELLRE